MGYFTRIWKGFMSLVSGMLLTWRYMRQKPVTILYPKENSVTPEFKGPIIFTEDADDKNHNCIACNACIKACPSRCMHLEVVKNDEGKRVLTDFKVDHSLCSTCSMCIDVCPTDALAHDPTGFAEVALSRNPLVHDLLQPFRDSGVNVDRPIMTPAQKKAAKEAAQKKDTEGESAQ